MAVEILPAETPAQLNTFIRLPWRLYAGDPHWVPPLVSEEKKMLDRTRNPFWEQAEGIHFLARRDSEPVGRISAILNRGHNEYTGEKTGFWGYFESVDDDAVSAALFDAAAAWLRERGMTRLLGPANPSMNDPCGLLVSGFDRPPYVMMTYNPERYARRVEAAGFTKAMDLLAYLLRDTGLVRDKIDRVARIVSKRSKVRLRPIDLGRFDAELEIIKEIYNDAWERNWGFVPMTDAEIRFAADGLKAVLLPEYGAIAEQEGKPVGFAFALPDINVSLRKCNGSLWPFGWVHFLKGSLRRIPAFRVVALGVRQSHQHLGIGTLFYQRLIENGLKNGVKEAELSWILEDNEKMNRPLLQMGAEAYRRYRLYEKPL